MSSTHTHARLDLCSSLSPFGHHIGERWVEERLLGRHFRCWWQGNGPAAPKSSADSARRSTVRCAQPPAKLPRAECTPRLRLLDFVGLWKRWFLRRRTQMMMRGGRWGGLRLVLVVASAVRITGSSMCGKSTPTPDSTFLPLSHTHSRQIEALQDHIR